jgi:prepilin-type N-terminal cleavage/methylation domain-containing protein
VAIRPPKYNSQGYTLLEMLAVILLAGIVMGFAAPSLLSLNKPLRDGTIQFKSHLGLIRSKAISTNQAYRIRPKYPTVAQYTGDRYQQTPHNFIVEYAANCQVSTEGYGLRSSTAPVDPDRAYNATYPNGIPDGWMAASQFDLDLPETIGVASTPLPKMNNITTTASTRNFVRANTTGTTGVAFDASLNWEICYDNRGVAFQPVELTLKDFQGNNKATSAFIQVGIVGALDISTKDRNTTAIPVDSQGNPVF